MTKMCLAFLGALLLVLHLISTQVVQGQYTTDAPSEPTKTMTMTMNMSTSSYSMNVTGNLTVKAGCGRTAAPALLLPLAAAASLLLGWS